MIARIVRRIAGRPADPARERGQGLVEMTLVLPLLMLLLVGMLELGLAFHDTLTIGYASREGSRTGAALAQGGALSCATPDPGGVDTAVVAAVERILTSPGSDLALADVRQIRIFKADTNGNPVGSAVNIWRYAPGAGPDVDPGPSTVRLSFTEQTRGWAACGRITGSSPDSLGVEVEYAYRLTTPLGSIIGIVGGDGFRTLTLRERTVMALNPTL